MTPPPSLHRICLTGGPCGGKTTSLSQVTERLQALGYRVFVVPEIPTILITGGVSFHDLTRERLLRQEAQLLRLQLAAEDAFTEIARSCGAPAVVVCDRGTMDVSAYLPPDLWQALLDEEGWTAVALRDARYEAVVHLVSAAVGAEAFYTTANNPARHATAEQARVLDAKTMDAWVGHPRLRVVDNGSDFAGKVRRVCRTFCRIVGAPEPLDLERKFLVGAAPAADAFPVRSEEVEIEQTYLLSPDGAEARVRRRGRDGAYAYFHKVRRPPVAGQRVELERRISGRQYLGLLASKDPGRRVVRKLRRCFVWENVYFELDRFLDPAPGLLLLEAEVDSLAAPLALPPFVQIEHEVTADARYRNNAIARETPGA
ncbi:MAG: AAA family ATPase [Planctomycetes bacterium]|nr:AAA family ATPase [Planctomycetota bacterium]